MRDLPLSADGSSGGDESKEAKTKVKKEAGGVASRSKGSRERTRRLQATSALGRSLRYDRQGISKQDCLIRAMTDPRKVPLADQNEQS
jgi:hypothetical protein